MLNSSPNARRPAQSQAAPIPYPPAPIPSLRPNPSPNPWNHVMLNKCKINLKIAKPSPDMLNR